MNTLAFDAKKFVKIALRCIAFHLSIIMIAMATMFEISQAAGVVPAGYSASWPPGATYGDPPHYWAIGGSTAAYPSPSGVCTDAAVVAYLNAYWSYTPIQNIHVIGTAFPFSCRADFRDKYGGFYPAVDYSAARVAYHNACPANSQPAGAACACDANYTPDSAGTSCVSACPVGKLADITDPVALLYENGTYNSTNPDIEHLTPETQAGLACIKQKVIATNCNMTPQATSGYRPAAYQKHIYDVYTKWQQIKDNNTPECAEVKAAIKKQFDNHRPFAREPGKTSNHSQTDAQGNPAGTAVDIAFVPDNALISADAIACQCNMYRPLINMPNPKDNDPVHYQPRICPR